ncbi:MAG TPA: ATP-binding protein, partial [Verrucomicrobiae bacterium]|nr:ATP-binding protein [Verrucomicrobiae bacterium]
MSNTRRASSHHIVSQERYLSSPEYAELRGISGIAVTTKAQFMAHPAKRSLLFFLQAISLRPGGLQKLARELAEMFPERLGTDSMFQWGHKPGKRYTQEQKERIEREMWRQPGEFDLLDDEDRVELKSDPHGIEKPHPIEDCVNQCRKKMIEKAPGFIIELCINPRLQFRAPGETETSMETERVSLNDNLADEPLAPIWERGSRPAYQIPELPFFRGIIGALFEYKKRYEEDARRDYVQTEAGRKTFEALDRGLATGKIVMIEGESGIGKSTAAQAWAEMHLGEARLISMSGITHKTGLFRALAKALGIGSSYARSSTELQTRIEDLLERSKLMVLIDEAHHAFSSAERVYSRPELVDWINCALHNHGVPVGLIVTPQFRLRMARAQKQTTWNADQFRRRCVLTLLDARPALKDIGAVARKLMPDASADCLKFLTGYAMTSTTPLPALVDAVNE